MPIIAQQLGHADIRMTLKHYAHLAPSYVADVVRASLPVFGIVEPSPVRAGETARAISLGDIDADGDLDALGTAYSSNKLTVHLNQGGAFSFPVTVDGTLASADGTLASAREGPAKAN